MTQLVFSRGQTPFFQVLLQLSSTKIGRSPQCDIVLSDPEISREHAVIYLQEGKFYLKKIGGAGLKVNGKDAEFQPLVDQDTIALGPWEARFQVSETADFPGDTGVTESDPTLTQALALSSNRLLVHDLKLVVQGPSQSPQVHSFITESLMVGAHEKNDVVLSDPYVSSRHCKLIRQNGSVRLYDLGSTNGTFVNGVKVREAEIEVGSQIKIGPFNLSLQVEENLEIPSQVEVDQFCGLWGSSKSMRNLYGLLKRIGPSEATALILGESGTGKELVARAIHHLSLRRSGPFVAINCGAISPELIESELFGHEKGAFTGAQRQHDGAFGQAEGGTLFLDEIGELPLALQPKLLRVLENRAYRRVGGSEELAADVRIVAATHRDLATAVQEKKFREDLFFRLFVLPILLSPLRERIEDIPLLCQNFLKEFSTGTNPKLLSSGALEKLCRHSFPGNIRELKNILLRSVILSASPSIEEADLLFLDPRSVMEGEGVSSEILLEKLEEMERRLVLKALKVHQWNKAKAAEALGVAKSTLFAKIKAYGLEDPNGEI